MARWSRPSGRGRLADVLEQVTFLDSPVTGQSDEDIALSSDLRAVALMNLGILEAWSLALPDAERHLLQGAALAREFGRPYLEVSRVCAASRAGPPGTRRPACGGQPPVPGGPRGVAPRGLAEPLSPGELRVLRYLPTNLSRIEIARDLSVSPNTVSTHIRSIYAKLGVGDRSSAVQRARQLRLLAAGRPTRPG